MNPIIRNIMAVIVGILFGGLVNMGIISLGGQIIPPPDGVDVTNAESMKALMHLFQAKHFVTPFLAHAIGTLIGAMLTSLIAISQRLKLALFIGVFFLIGGSVAVFLISPPIWMIILDLLGAYIPMSWLGWKLSGKE